MKKSTASAGTAGASAAGAPKVKAAKPGAKAQARKSDGQGASKRQQAKVKRDSTFHLSKNLLRADGCIVVKFADLVHSGGPWHKLWLAAHWDRKLRRDDWLEINLTRIVSEVRNRRIPLMGERGLKQGGRFDALGLSARDAPLGAR